ncbi:hypothetical protein HPULCUR_001351 [Helicostylum pulchrum]|uniref:3-hydroxyisobutyryl-CoA hydrolase n=1 Tax=Helicostylum pulchrum TaxID=562976 RepID=A0ABP9XMI6_9FUNG
MEASEKVNIVFFQGEGTAFSAGADIKAIANMTTYPSGRQELENFVDIYFKMTQLPYIKQSLIDLNNPSYSTIREVIEKYSVKPDHIPISYTLHGERRNIIDSCFQFDTVAEILEALQKEGSAFSLETISQISRGSPISVALTLEQLRRGSMLSLAQCLIMENKSWKVGPFDRDFRKGVYSTMAKERAPQWSRTNYSDVDFKKDVLDRYINADIKQTLYLESDEREIYFDARYRERGLPTEEEVKQVKYGSNLRTNEEIIACFVDLYNNKYGVRQEVEEILKKYHNL